MCSSSRSKPASLRRGRRRARTRRARGPCPRGPSRAATGQSGANGSGRRRERRPARPSRERVRRRPTGRLHEPLRPACASCMPIFARRVRVHEVDDALPRRPRARPSYMPVQPGVMRASARDVGHLGDHEPGAADRAAAEVHEVPVVRRAVLAEYWHIGETTTRFASVSPRSRNGSKSGGSASARRRHGGASRAPARSRPGGSRREPLGHARDERGVAHRAGCRT